MATFNIKTLFRFGKHKGEPIGEVIDKDPEYVLWVQENLNMTFSKEIKTKLLEYKACR